MSNIAFGGLATGIDTASIVSQLMSLERAPEKLLTAKQTANSTKVSEFQKIEDALKSLQTIVQGFSSPDTFSSVKTTVADSSVLSVMATGKATPGTHTVQVISLAKSQRQISTGVASDTALSFSTGSFTIDGGAAITIGEGQNSLQGIVAAINASGTKVSASVINDGTNYRMVINGTDAQNHAFDFSGMASAPTLLGPGDPTYQDAASAQLVVDGVAMTKASNTVTDAIQGVTLNLTAEGGASTNLSVANDTDAVTAKLNNFVAAYNKAITLVNSQSSYDSTTKKAGALSGNSTVRAIQQQLRSLLTATVPGISGSITTLGALGIKSDSKTGNLSVDAAKLSDAMSNHYSDMVDYLTHNGNSMATLASSQYGVAGQFNLVIESMVHAFVADGMSTNGSIEVAKKSLNDANSDIDKQISAMEDRITMMQTNLQNRFNAMELLVSSLKNQGNALIGALNAANNTSTTSG